MSVKSAIPVLLFPRTNTNKETKEGVNKKKRSFCVLTLYEVDLIEYFVDSMRIKNKKKKEICILLFFNENSVK